MSVTIFVDYIGVEEDSFAAGYLASEEEGETGALIPQRSKGYPDNLDSLQKLEFILERYDNYSYQELVEMFNKAPGGPHGSEH